MVHPRETANTITIPGPVGDLEAIDQAASTDRSRGIAVICHPHPLHGGTMRNKVVQTLAKGFNDAGFGAVRFNYRGVEGSHGDYGYGAGEVEDALAVVEWAVRTYSPPALWLAGFSFGGYVSLVTARQAGAQGLISVAPAVNLLDFRSQPPPDCPWFVIQGDEDEVVPCKDVLEYVNSLARRPTVLRLKGAGHFFHGRLTDLRSAVVTYLNRRT